MRSLLSSAVPCKIISRWVLRLSVPRRGPKRGSAPSGSARLSRPSAGGPASRPRERRRWPARWSASAGPSSSPLGRMLLMVSSCVCRLPWTPAVFAGGGAWGAPTSSAGRRRGRGIDSRGPPMHVSVPAAQTPLSCPISLLKGTAGGTWRGAGAARSRGGLAKPPVCSATPSWWLVPAVSRHSLPRGGRSRPPCTASGFPDASWPAPAAFVHGLF